MVANLVAIWIVLMGFGIFYALYIKYWPIKPTWVSVAIGDGAICLAEMSAIFVVLWFNELFWEFWWLILLPPVALLTAGVPMAVIQQKKWEEVNKHNEEVIEIHTEK